MRQNASSFILNNSSSVLHENNFGVGQLAVRLVKKYILVNDLPVKSTPISRPQGKFIAKIHQQADGLQNREVRSLQSIFP